MAKTMFEKIWAGARGARARAGGRGVADLRRPASRARGHVARRRSRDCASPAARSAGRTARSRPPTTTSPPIRASAPRLDAIADHLSRKQVEALEHNCEEFGIPLYGMRSRRQGIVHVIGPGARALAARASRSPAATRTPPPTGRSARWRCRSAPPRSSTCWRRSACRRCKPKTMRITYEGEPGFGVTAKDLILGTIGQISAAGAVGHAVEYAGAPIAALSVEGRMTICNMSIEAGARAGHDRPGRHHLRVPGGTPRRAGRLRGDGRAVALAPDGSRRHVRHRDHRGRGRAQPAGDLGDESRPGGRGHAVACPTRRASRARPTASPPSARWRTWRSSPGPRSRTSASTACSSGRARTPASRTCAPPPRWSAAAASRRRCTRWSCPARCR